MSSPVAGFVSSRGLCPSGRGGFTVGAIAASGASAQQDEDTVRVAVVPAGER